MRCKMLVVLMLVCLATSAQVWKSGEERKDSLEAGYFYSLNGTNPKEETIELKTHETTIQKHDGEEIYRMDREVKYLVNREHGKVTVFRKVLSSPKTKFDSSCQKEQLFPDMTSKLQCAMLQPRKTKLADLNKKEIPCLVTEKEGEAVFYIDKLALAGGKIEDKFMGITMNFNFLAETLVFKCINQKSCLGNLDSIVSKISLQSSSKHDGSHLIELVETIKLQEIH